MNALTEPLEEAIEHPVARSAILDCAHEQIIERARQDLEKDDAGFD